MQGNFPVDNGERGHNPLGNLPALIPLGADETVLHSVVAAAAERHRIWSETLFRSPRCYETHTLFISMDTEKNTPDGLHKPF